MYINPIEIGGPNVSSNVLLVSMCPPIVAEHPVLCGPLALPSGDGLEAG